jgi:hypothetical protein
MMLVVRRMTRRAGQYLSVPPENGLDGVGDFGANRACGNGHETHQQRILNQVLAARISQDAQPPDERDLLISFASSTGQLQSVLPCQEYQHRLFTEVRRKP